jgi:hypothetical protein
MRIRIPNTDTVNKYLQLNIVKTEAVILDLRPLIM